MNKPIFLIIIFAAFSSSAICQKADSTEISNVFIAENPYTKNQTKWLNENGFNTTEYSWEDGDINSNLDKAIELRSSAKTIGITGGTLFMLNLIGNALAGAAHDMRKKELNKGEYDPDRRLYYIGGAMVATSLVLSFNAQKKLIIAKEKLKSN